MFWMPPRWIELDPKHESTRDCRAMILKAAQRGKANNWRFTCSMTRTTTLWRFTKSPALSAMTFHVPPTPAPSILQIKGAEEHTSTFNRPFLAKSVVRKGSNKELRKANVEAAYFNLKTCR